MDVGQIFNKATMGAASGAAKTGTADRTEYTKGRTIGKPSLSKEGAKYYEELKKKYGDMDFILVSEDEKANAESNAGAYANANRMVVLIDEDKIERMATDENYRKQYEGIIDAAKKQLPELQKSLQTSGANIKSFGIKVNDNGTASFFAVMDKSMTAQREKIAEKRAEKKAETKAKEKKAEQKKQAEKLEEKREASRGSKKKDVDTDKFFEDTETVTSDSIEGLLKQIQNAQMSLRSDTVLSETERLYGQSIDFKG